MAHLYENWGKKEKIDPCMQEALRLLQDDSLVHNGYYAFVCEKCAPSFLYFGYESAGKELEATAKELYERA